MSATSTARLAPTRFAKAPNKNEHGMPTNCTRSSARIMLPDERPMPVPKIVAMRMIVRMPSLYRRKAISSLNASG